MALAVDAVSTGKASSASSLSFNHTCSGSNRGLVVFAHLFQNGGSVGSGVTFNSASLTAVPSAIADNGDYRVEAYSLIAPDSGTFAVDITLSGSTFEISAGAISFTDVHQTTMIGSVNTATGTSTAPSVTVSSSTTELVVAALTIIHNGTLSVGTGQTARWSDIGNAGFMKYAGSTEPGDASTVMSWSNTTSQLWAVSAFAIRPTTVVSAGVSSNLLLLGVG